MAERYSKRRFLSNFGQTQGPKAPDTSGFSRAVDVQQQTLSSGIDAIQKILQKKAEKGAERRAAQNAVSNDPYVLLQKTEGSINFEDELTRKHAITKIKNTQLDKLTLQIKDAEEEAFNNDDSSETFLNTVTGIVQQNLKGLRESGVDAPIMELELQELVAPVIRRKIDNYGSNRIKIKSTQLSNELKRDLKNIAGTGDGQLLDDAKLDHADYLDKNPGFAGDLDKIYNRVVTSNMLNSVQKASNNAVSFKDILKIQKELIPFENDLPEYPDQQVLNNLQQIKNELLFKIGDANTAIAMVENRNSKLHSEYSLEENASVVTEVSAVANILDNFIVKGIINRNTPTQDILEQVSIAIDADGLVNADFVETYINEALGSYEQNKTTFVENRSNITGSGVSNGSFQKTKIETRYSNGLDLLSTDDIAEVTKEMDLARPENAYQYYTNLIKSAGPYNGIAYKNLVEELPAEHQRFIRAIEVGNDRNKTHPQEGINYSKVIAKGFLNEATAKLNNDIDREKKSLRDQKVTEYLTQYLPGNINEQGDKQTLYYAYKNAVTYTLLAKGQDVPEDAEIETLIQEFTGYKEKNGDVINGYADMSNGKIYLDKTERPEIIATDNNMRQGLTNLLENNLLYKYTKRLDIQDGEPTLVFDETEIKIDPALGNQGAVAGTEIPLTAEKLRSNFVFINADISHFNLPNDVELPLVKNVKQLVVARDVLGNILRYADNAPVLFDLKQMGHEYELLLEPKPFVDTADRAYKISDVTATSKYRSAVDVPGPTTRSLDPTPTIDPRSQLEKILDYRLRTMR